MYPEDEMPQAASTVGAHHERAYLDKLSRSGRSPGIYADEAKQVTKASMSSQIIQRLKEAMETTQRVNSILNEKHCSLFGHPAPSAPSPLRGETAGEPEGFEAQVRMILSAPNDRLSDVESAAQSLSARI